MLVCCVPGCNNRYVPNGLRFLSLPQGLRNEQRRKMWEKNIGKSLSNKSVVCELHFTKDQFELNRKDGKKLLRWNAIPTIFPLRKPRRILVKDGRFVSNMNVREEPLEVSKNPLPNSPKDTPTTYIVLNVNNDITEARVNNSTESLILVQKTVSAEKHKAPSIERKEPSRLVPAGKQNPPSLEKRETPRFVPIAPRIESTDYISLMQTDIKEYKREIQRYKDDIRTYKKNINALSANVKILTERNAQKTDCLKKMFDDDQIQVLFRKGESDKDISWGCRTIDKAVELYEICGSKGYQLLLQSNLPYPSLETLKKLKPHLFDGRIDTDA